MENQYFFHYRDVKVTVERVQEGTDAPTWDLVVENKGRELYCGFDYRSHLEAEESARTFIDSYLVYHYL